ncbi:hypothetical protein DIPPA_20873 [Diplonema papillatum]|nr:hypothetical protein DIPPA_20873 [Diplonema papillatum]
MAMKTTLEGKDKQTDEVKRSSDQVVRRLKDTFTIREETLKRGADEMAGKVTALQQERATQRRRLPTSTAERPAGRSCTPRPPAGSFGQLFGLRRVSRRLREGRAAARCRLRPARVLRSWQLAHEQSPQPPSRRPCSAPSCRRKIR